MFGKEIKLNIKQKDKQKSLFGTLISIGIIVTCLINFIDQADRAFSRKFPSIQTKTVSDIKPKKLQFNKENFSIGIIVYDKNNQAVNASKNEQYFQVQLITYLFEQNNVTKQQQDLIPCTDSNAQTLHFKDSEYFIQNIESFYCLEMNKIDLIQLDQSYSSDYYQWVEIFVMQCNHEKNANCASQEKIQQRLSYGSVEAFITSGQYDMSIQNDPYYFSNKLIFANFKENYAEQVNIKYFHHTTITEENFFKIKENTFKQESFLLNENIERGISFRNAYATFYIDLDDKLVYMERSYNDLIQILGNTGGLMSLLITAFAVLVNYVVTTQTYIILMNKLFIFPNFQDPTKKKNQNKRQQRKSAKPSANNQDSENKKDSIEPKNHQIKPRFSIIQQNEQGDRMDNSIQLDKGQIPKMAKLVRLLTNRQNKIDQESDGIKQLKKFLSQNTQKLTIGFYEGIRLIFGGDKNKLIQKGSEKINKMLDVTYIIQRFHEFEKLKKLLLTKDQLNLLEYVPKEKIQLIEDIEVSDEDLLIDDHQKEDLLFKKKIENIIQSFQNIQKKEKNEYDLKLISMMDPDIKNVLQEATKFQEQNESNLVDLQEIRDSTMFLNNIYMTNDDNNISQ